MTHIQPAAMTIPNETPQTWIPEGALVALVGVAEAWVGGAWVGVAGTDASRAVGVGAMIGFAFSMTSLRENSEVLPAGSVAVA